MKMNPKNYTENGVELAKAFGPEEIESMEQVMKNYSVDIYYTMRLKLLMLLLTSIIVGIKEAMEKMSEGNLGPGDLELLKPMVDMDSKVYTNLCKNIIKKY